ncbi:3'-5' exonuclease [Persephonella sp.]
MTLEDIRKIGKAYVFGVLSDDKNKTEEEKAFEKFIKIFEDIPSIGYYRPPIKSYLSDKEPDGLWINHNIGIVVFEIKLWDRDFLSDKQFDSFERLVDKNGEDYNKNPYRQSFEYRQIIINEIKQIKPLPVINIVYFPNLKESNITDLHPSIRDLIIQNKDITIFKDTNKEKALEKILERLKVNSFISVDKIKEGYEFDTISEEEYQKIKAVLFPIVQIPKKILDTFDIENIPVLDFYQEGLLYRTKPVKKPENGKLYSDKILRGTAGTGKSVVIQAKALFEKYLHPEKKVVFISYTNSLVNEARNNIKTLIEKRSLPVNINDIEFYTIDSLIARIFLSVAGEEGLKKEDETYNQYLNRAVDYLISYVEQGNDLPDEFKYDVILVDESQDLTKKHIQIIHHLKKDTYIAIWGVDETQRIYGSDKENDSRNWNWKEVGVQAAGNTIILRRTYRNPGSIVKFARKFLSLDEVMIKRLKEFDLSDIEILRNGSKDIEFIETNNGHIKDVLVKKVANLIDEGYKFKDIMILLPFKNLIQDVGEHLKIVFQEENISYFSSASTKQEKEVFQNKLNVLSYHSSKGLEKPVVIVSSINYYPHTSSKLVEDIRVERRLLYVAMTRPLEKLILVYDNYLDRKRKELLTKNPKSVDGLSFGEELKRLYENMFTEKKKSWLGRLFSV